MKLLIKSEGLLAFGKSQSYKVGDKLTIKQGDSNIPVTIIEVYSVVDYRFEIDIIDVESNIEVIKN